MLSKNISEIIPAFVKSLQDKGRSPSTILAYRADLEQLIYFLDNIEKKEVDLITTHDLNMFRDWLLNQKYTPKSTSRKLNAVKTFFRWLKENSVLSADPSREVSHPKIETSIPQFLNPLEYRALRDIVRTDERIAAIVEIILQTGMRISEVANLKLSGVKDDSIGVEAYATQPERQIPLNEPAKTALDNYLAKRPQSQSEYIFVSKNGKPLAVRNIRAAIDRYMQKAEIPQYSVNDLRTTFIVENLKRGVDLITLSHVSGHKRLSTTERYLEMAGVKEPGKKQKLEEL